MVRQRVIKKSAEMKELKVGRNSMEKRDWKEEKLKERESIKKDNLNSSLAVSTCF